MAAHQAVRVMVVDDDADMRFLVSEVLATEAGLELVAQADGAEAALAAVGAAAPDVALVDARMPLTDGFELTPRLLTAAPGMRIALLTSLVDEVVQRRARDAGAAACVAKGDVDAIVAVVRRLGPG